MINSTDRSTSIPVRPEQRDYRVEIVDNQLVLSRWQEIQKILLRVFRDSHFNDDFKCTRPVEHTWEKIHEPSKLNIKHVMAFDADDEILGAFFVIPTHRPPGKEDCDIGWMFTIELHTRFRLQVLDSIVKEVHSTIKTAGFKRIITEMGTEAGASFLTKKYGYIHTPTEQQNNRWIKELM